MGEKGDYSQLSPITEVLVTGEQTFYLHNSITTLSFPTSTYKNTKVLHMYGFPKLLSLVFGEGSFPKVESFSLSSMEKLTNLQFGKNSFTEKKDYYGENPSRIFSLTNCSSLLAIEFGRFAFSDYAGNITLWGTIERFVIIC